jgi:hypothetical protein
MSNTPLSKKGKHRADAATAVQSIVRGKAARTGSRDSQRMDQIESVYGKAPPTSPKPASELDRLRLKMGELEKQNRMLQLRLEPLPAQAASTVMAAGKKAATAPRAASGTGGALWSLEAWLQSVPMAKIVSSALLKHLKAGAPAGTDPAGLEHAFMDQLGTSGDLATFMALLKDALVLEEIADALFASAKKLARKSEEARKRALRSAEKGDFDDEDAKVLAFASKFVDDGAHELVMGDLSTFFRQLTGLVGPPSQASIETMREEHCTRADYKVEFEAGNYGTRTTSHAEFVFVADGAAAPVEARIAESHRRKPRTVASYASGRSAADGKLAKLGVEPISDAEFVGARLYTGPLYVRLDLT